MKKVFISISAIFMVVVVVIIILLNTMKKNVNIEFENPTTIRVYNKSTNPTVNNGYKKGSEEYDKLIYLINDMTNLTYYQRLLYLKTIDTKIEGSEDGTFSVWNSDIKSKNLVIELEFDDEQDVVVYQGEHSRVISYYCISYVFSNVDKMGEVVVYYSTTNSSSNRDESYAKCTPMVLKGNVSDIVNYANQITSTVNK